MESPAPLSSSSSPPPSAETEAERSKRESIDDNDDECQYWMSKIKNVDGYDVKLTLKDAPKYIRSNKKVVMAAVQKYAYALEYASPSLHNDKQFVLAVVQQNGYALQFASPSLKNDVDVVMAAAKGGGGSALKYASPSLQNDKQVVLAVVRQYGYALEFASPSLKNDVDVVMAAIKQNGFALQFASPNLQNDKQVVIASLRKQGSNLRYASPALQDDKQVVIASVQKHFSNRKYASPALQRDKGVVLTALKQNPNIIKDIPENLKRDPDVLVAAGMFDSKHPDAVARQQGGNIRKITLSTRFSLKSGSVYEATNFTALLKKSNFIEEGAFIVYAPNAFDKKTCDPEWTRFDWPCRGTIDTCQYNNVLTDAGHPTDDCCWRYSFRSQLQEAKDTGGFMLQLIETDPSTLVGVARLLTRKVKDATLGNGQWIELNIAISIGVKVFQVYCPENELGHEMKFLGHDVDNFVTAKIAQWYDNQCQDMNVTVIRPYSPMLRWGDSNLRV